MPTLPVDQLIRGIKEGQPVAPLMIDDEVLDRYIERVMAHHITLGTGAVEVRQLFRHLQGHLDFVSQERRVLLSQCEMYVLPFPLCITYAHEFDGRKIIVVATGLIDLIANTVLASYLQSMLPKALDTYYLRAFRQDMPASHLVANALFLLQLHFYRQCAPLPNLHALVPPAMLKESAFGIDGAVLFILLHELGHHSLNHLHSEKIRPMRYHTILHEGLSIDQHQEMDADHFALESLIKPAHVIGTFWHQFAMNYFMQIELACGEHSSLDHPAAINRAYSSDALRSECGRGYDVTPRHAFYETLAARYGATQQASRRGGNAFINTSREGCVHLLQEINQVLEPFDMDISPLWETAFPSWLDTRVS
jgi:hypothetical protein